ncbi:MAG: cobalt-precorrin-5B (C(1))-methyltransferase CbiD [Nitrospirae bacterium]|nr:cobalt-precorrin-5B (C(1))-methyltransferase CbiD [Nitrospirota bacterium]
MINSRDKRRGLLRSGYTTGACAAAAAKAAATLLLGATVRQRHSAAAQPASLPLHDAIVEIPFPDGSRHKFRIHDARCLVDENRAWTSVIKKSGDDPDVTNGAEIAAEAKLQNTEYKTQGRGEKNGIIERLSPVLINGGKGVGIVTKPGLAVSVGEAAINPVPKKMIGAAVMEAISNSKFRDAELEITISVPDGEILAKKTLNSRLGIIGGISILGTTGVVKPISTEAWTSTIVSSMDVAKAMGREEIVLSAGRTSERAHMNKYKLPEESYVMMGDYLEFSLNEAKKHGFKKIHLCAQWAKMLKIAMSTSQKNAKDRADYSGYTTHVRHGAINIKNAVEFLKVIQPSLFSHRRSFNTAREIFDFINGSSLRPKYTFKKVCASAKKYAEGVTGSLPFTIHLASYDGKIIAASD